MAGDVSPILVAQARLADQLGDLADELGLSAISPFHFVIRNWGCFFPFSVLLMASKLLFYFVI
jgi:hypothetical protein